jgi:GTP-binding protein
MEDYSPPAKPIFVDEVEIFAIAGGGGNGCMAFRREKYIPHGGPAGGDGGHGGSVYLVADQSYTTLQHLAGKHHWRAGRGGHGEGKNCHGRNGKAVHIRVPAGTIVYDADHGILLKDLARHDESICVASGGKGGRGNTHFKTPTNQAPRIAEPGEPGQQRKLRLELKLIADAGLIGKPNAGKSTLLSHLTKARPKIAAYPFTTLRPHLGIVEMARFRRFVLADIPGLIEGAHAGAGLGDAFLRHVERTRILVHMLDVCSDESDAADAYRTIRQELEQYSDALAAKPEIVVANKMDLTGADEALAELQRELDCEVIGISAVTGRGLDKLTERIWQLLQQQTPDEDTPAD